MSANQSKPPIQQATPFQRFTIRLVDGRFVRVPKSDLPVMHGVDQSATSNQTAIRDLFQLVNGQFVRVTGEEIARAESIVARPPPGSLTTAPEYPDPTFDVPADLRLPEAK